MLIRSSTGRRLIWAVFALVLGVLVISPIAVTAITAFAQTWNSALPSGLTTDHMASTLTASNMQSILVSIQTALMASAVAVALGTWAALAARSARPRLRAVIDPAFHVPVAVPSVVIGLAVLIAFSRSPLIFNGTPWIVILVQALLVLSFAFSMVSAAAKGLDPALDQVAGSLGASGRRTLPCRCSPRPSPRPPDYRWRCAWASSARRSWCTRRPGGPCRSPSSPSPIAVTCSARPPTPCCWSW